MSVSEASGLLAASDKTWLGSGLYRYHLCIRVRDSVVLVDPQPADVVQSGANERLFRGALRPGVGGAGSVLEGCFYSSRLVRFVFFPVPLLGGVGGGAAAVVHRSWPLGFIGIVLLYFAVTFVIPRLLPVDARRCEAMIRDCLITLLQPA